MKITKDIQQLVSDIVMTYSKYDRTSDHYYLDKRSIPSFMLNELSSAILESEPEFANEALSVDNMWFESRMVPALTEYLADETNKDTQIKFLDVFRNSITAYLKNQIDKYLEWGEEDYNHSRKEGLREHRNPNYLQVDITTGSYV